MLLTRNLAKRMPPTPLIRPKNLESAEIRRMNKSRRLPRHHNEARLQDALTAMEHVQKTTPKGQRAVHRARRKVARINKAMKRSAIRKQFHINDSRCVADIFRRALSSENAPDDVVEALDAGF